MSDDTTPWIKGSELGSVITQPLMITPKLRGLTERFGQLYRKETKEEARAVHGRGWGASPDWLIKPMAVQELLNDGRLVLKAEPPEGSNLPSPAEFCRKYGLLRPGR